LGNYVLKLAKFLGTYMVCRRPSFPIFSIYYPGI